MSKQYCVDCKDFKEHIPKLSAIMSGHLVCDNCHVMNGFCTLIKPNDSNFRKGSSNVLWIEWDENQRGKATHQEPKVGYSLLMSPFNDFFTWQTTPITELIEYNDSFVHFKTENSEYKLYVNKEAIEEFMNKKD